MFSAILAKEWQLLVRQRRTWVASALLIMLTVAACWVSYSYYTSLAELRTSANAEMHERWVDQGDKHPHSAAHYGNIVFRGTSPLAFFDDGIDRYVGTYVFLEAHKQNDVLLSDIAQSGTWARFGALSPAMVLQFLLPLALIFVGFDSVSRELERGTLRLQILQGGGPRTLLLAKWLALCGVALLLCAPAFVWLLYAAVDAESSGAGTWTRALTLILAYSLYGSLMAAMVVIFSSWLGESRPALLSLLGVWMLFAVLIPRSIPMLTEQLYDTQSREAFAKTVHDGVAEGIDGHNPMSSRFDALKAATLKQYGVDSLEQLPVNWSGIAMQAGEEYTDEVYDQAYDGLASTFERQRRAGLWLGLLSPLVAMRDWSMHLAGTSLQDHFQFSRQAEDYRRQFVAMMNGDMRDNHKPGVAYKEYKRDASFWAQLPPFNGSSISAGAALRQGGVSALLCVLWWLGLGGLVYVVGGRLAQKITV